MAALMATCLSIPFSTAMVSITAIFTLLGLAATAYSVSFTTPVTPNERLCFYADVDKAGEKIGVRSSFTSLRHSSLYVFSSSTSLSRAEVHSTSITR